MGGKILFKPRWGKRSTRGKREQTNSTKGRNEASRRVEAKIEGFTLFHLGNKKEK